MQQDAEPGDVEHPLHGTGRSDELESAAPLAKPPPCAYEDSETSGVEERDGCEIEDERGGAGREGFMDPAPQLVRR